MKLFQIPGALFLSAALLAPPGAASAQFVGEASFSAGGGSAYVYATVMQSDGKVVAVGSFTTIESTTRNNIARLTTAGALDSSFNPNANGLINHALVQDDDKILIVGNFTTVGGTSRNGFARLNADGTLDTSFAPTFNNGVYAAALQDDGKILVGGAFTSVNSTTRNRIARLNSDGSLDSGFNPNANGAVQLLTIRPDGKIMASGAFGSIGGGSRSAFARLDASGSLDTSFTHGGSSTITSCPLIAADGSMAYVVSIGGSYTNVEEVANDGTYVGTMVDMSSTDNIFPSILGTKTVFYAPSGNGNLWYYSGGSASAVYYFSPLVQMSLLRNGGLLYSSGNGPAQVGQYNFSAPAQTLTYESGTTLRWSQAVAFPAFDYTKFQLSTDGGGTWSDLGFGTKTSSTQYDLTVTQPSSGLIRAVGGTKAGQGGISRSLIASKVVSITPEIDLTGNSQPILDGDTTPSLTDHTDFDTQAVSSGTKVRTFTVANPGATQLVVSSISVSGTHAGDFSVSALSSSMLPQTTGTFDVTFDPSALGTRTATITIASDDPDEASFEFDILGTGVEPEINVKGNSTNIVDGDSTPSSSDHTDYGNVVYTAPVVRTFTIENTSSDPLTVSSITRTGDTANFTISGISLPATVAASSSTTFTVTFNPGVTLGSKSATVTITNDDADEGSYDFAVQAVGVAPEIDVKGNSVSIADFDSTPSLTDHTDFGTPAVGGTVVRTFTIENTGTSSLTVSSITLSGHTTDFTVGGISLPAVVAASSSTTFTVTYNPLNLGLRSATVWLYNDDATENVYDFAIQGTSSTEINIQGGGTNIAISDSTPSLVDDTDFGVAVSGVEQVVVTYTIQNLGTGPLSVTALNKVGTHHTDYTISGLSLPATVVSGGSATFNVTFAPSALGIRSATLTVLSNDYDEGSYSYAVQGRGVEAGEVDTGFNPNSNAQVNAAVVQPDGKIIVAGTFITMGGTSRDRVARINQDGTLDTSFADPNITNGEVTCLALQRDGKVLIGGTFTTINANTRNKIARLNADGSLDTYNPNATSSSTVFGISVQSDDTAIVSGSFTAIGGQPRNRVARLSTAGAADSFNPNAANNIVHGSVTQADGSVILYGTFTTVGSTTRNKLARVSSSGTLDTGYNPNINVGNVNCAVLQSDGKLLIGGTLTSIGGTSGYDRLARINTDGTLDTSFTNTATANAEVHSFALQADGKLFVSGQLTTLSGTARGYAGRLNTGGTLDTTFVNPGANSWVYGATLQQDGKLLLGGIFTTVDGGTGRNRLARFENNVATETLSVTSSSRIEWLRGGSSPEASFVIFEKSTDGGSSWSTVDGISGLGTRITNGWEITGLTLPGSGKIRATAFTRGGRKNGSQGIVQTVIDF